MHTCFVSCLICFCTGVHVWLLIHTPTRFQVADALKMDVESAVFKAMLGHFESDDAWNPAAPMEAIWIKMKEKRYKLDGLKGLTKVIDKEIEKEVMEKEISGTSSGSTILAVGNDPAIKLENEKWSKLQARLKVAKSGKGLFFLLHTYVI